MLDIQLLYLPALAGLCMLGGWLFIGERAALAVAARSTLGNPAVSLPMIVLPLLIGGLLLGNPTLLSAALLAGVCGFGAWMHAATEP